MKNLKKLSREDLKKMTGGLRNPNPGIMTPVGGGGNLVEPGKWCCCGSAGCSTGVYGDSNDLTCVDSGTSLQKC